MTPREIIDTAIYGPGDGAPWKTSATGRVIAALAAAGYVIVPAEPTEEMVRIGCEALAGHDSKFDEPRDAVLDIYNEMTWNAPK